MMSGSRTINLRYFAVLREHSGIDQEVLTTIALTPRELYAQVAERHKFLLPADKIGVAINNAFCPLDQVLNDGDNVVFIPPIAGS